MPSLATRIQLGEFDPVVAALIARYSADPKLAVEVVTGACEYPSPDGETAGDLSIRADELADDLDYLRRNGLTHDGKTITRLRIDELRAASIALLAVSDDEAAEARDRRWHDDTRPYIAPVQYR